MENRRDIRRAAPEDLDRVSSLLSEASLSPLPRDFPLSDVLVALEGSALVGVIALEVRGLLGLMHSAAVAPGCDRQAVGSSLLQALISRANELSLRELFFSSGNIASGNTASGNAAGSSVAMEAGEDFLAEAGFCSVPPDSVPSEIRTARQYREQGPDTGAVMRFTLATRYV